MPRRFPRTCPVCGRPRSKNLSTHLLKVHGLSSEERRPYLKQAQVSSWEASCQLPSAITEKPREKRVNQCEYLPPAKKPRVVRTTTSLATKPYSKFSFPHRFSLLVMDPTQSGKTYFVCMRMFWYYNQWQECYEDLKTSLGKSIRLKEVCPNCLKICVKSIPAITTL